MVYPATRYADVSVHKAGGVSAAPPAIPLLLPQPGEAVSWPEWWWRELREGGFLRRYLEREKVRLKEEIGASGKRERNFEQNRKSEFRRLASIPARLFFRWLQEDRHFWEDRKNLKSLKRDNPDLPIWL